MPSFGTLIHLWARSPCKILEPYDNNFLDFSNGGNWQKIYLIWVECVPCTFAGGLPEKPFLFISFISVVHLNSYWTRHLRIHTKTGISKEMYKCQLPKPSQIQQLGLYQILHNDSTKLKLDSNKQPKSSIKFWQPWQNYPLNFGIPAQPHPNMWPTAHGKIWISLKPSLKQTSVVSNIYPLLANMASKIRF